jgi:hypothetical protein
MIVLARAPSRALLVLWIAAATTMTLVNAQEPTISEGKRRGLAACLIKCPDSDMKCNNRCISQFQTRGAWSDRARACIRGCRNGHQGATQLAADGIFGCSVSCLPRSKLLNQRRPARAGGRERCSLRLGVLCCAATGLAAEAGGGRVGTLSPVSSVRLKRAAASLAAKRMLVPWRPGTKPQFAVDLDQVRNR